MLGGYEGDEVALFDRRNDPDIKVGYGWSTVFETELIWYGRCTCRPTTHTGQREFRFLIHASLVD